MSCVYLFLVFDVSLFIFSQKKKNVNSRAHLRLPVWISRPEIATAQTPERKVGRGDVR